MSTEDNTVPDLFFRDQALYGRYRMPMFIVMLSGFLWAMQPVVTYYALNPEVQEQIQNAVAMDTMIHFLIPGFLWVGFWVAFALLAHFLGARMRADRLFKLTAWGMAPFALVGFVRTVGKYYVYQDATLPVGVTVGRFPSEWRGYNELLAEFSSDPIFIGTVLGSCIFLLLSGYLWLFAIKYSTDLEDPKKIYITVVVPIAVYVGYTVVSTLL